MAGRRRRDGRPAPHGSTAASVATGFGVPLAGVFLWALRWPFLLGFGALLVGATRDPAVGELRAACARGDPSDGEFERRRARLDG